MLKFGGCSARSSCGRVSSKRTGLLFLGREQDKRAVADYAVGTAWDSEDASHLVEDAAAFVERIRGYLKGAGVTIEE